MSRNLRFRLKKYLEFLNKTELIILAYFPLAVAIIMVVALIGRKIQVGYMGLFWLEEFGRYMLIFITFLGASVAVKTRSHPKMQALYVKLPTRVQHLLWGIVFLACFAFFIYIDIYTWKHIGKLARLNVTTSTLTIPFFVAYLPIAVFTIFMAIRYSIESFKEFKAAFYFEKK